jgi:hypothetical protein
LTTDEARYTRNPDYIFRTIVDELVLVPIRQDVADMDCIYTLNGLGAFVWQRLEGPATLADLQQAILAEYAADPEAVAADLAVFVGEMVEIGAIRSV